MLSLREVPYERVRPDDKTRARSPQSLPGSLALPISFIGATIAVLSLPTMTKQADTDVRPAGQRSRYADLLRRAAPVMGRTALVTVLALGSTLGTPAFQSQSEEGNTTTSRTVIEKSPVQARVGR
ncbi:hypothetical protein [Cryobacterium serini]|uniref:Uncharacterized protein n=1 Tax=Cryobacterium serini TaxID=1259201 RepID=A0A4R9BN11_9MICO|nr:hypothetical protein [Cryobacterium serini]TFD87831.1 hypothetical protein E3T51_10235 [Cryobacterium serini]